MNRTILRIAVSAVAALSIVVATTPLEAELVRVETDRRHEILGGKSFGLAGAYEAISGKLVFAVDPTLAPNRIVTDIERAPLDASGRVAFSADFYLLKPVRMERANGALLLEVGNRGGKGLLPFFDFASGSTDPTDATDFGDGFLLERGFTLLWVGWQWDTPKNPGIMRMYPPIATGEGGKPIRGLVRSDFVVTTRETDHSLADRNHLAYPVADPDAPENVLTVRDGVEGERRTVDRSTWRFARVSDGAIMEDSGRVYLEGGFEPGKIYEVVYLSENPPLVGLGPTGIRDAVSRLKYEGASELGIPRGSIDRALGFGISQSGRFLRTFLYYGFNQDESGRRAFDGVIAHVAGGGRGSFNHRFAQASRDGHPYLNFFYPTDIFPFTDLEEVDPASGAKGGIQSRLSPELQPRVFYTNSSYEYWGRAASLTHTSIDGLEDARLPENVRIFQFAGSQHGPARFPPERTIGRERSNPMDFRWSMRALLVAMDDWVGEGAPPPASDYPTLEHKELVRPSELHFPGIPEVAAPTRVHEAYRADYGERFASEGIVTKEPPELHGKYPILVPTVDEDGNETTGIRLPELAVPLATYTGWNLFNEASGPVDELASMQGSFLPFPRTEAERMASGDPRRSIEARYRSREQYLGEVAEAAMKLIDERYLLPGDLPSILANAGRHWDYLLAAGTDQDR